MASGWFGWDWGNVPSWIGSVLTSTSLLIAAVSYRRSVKDKAREQWDREREQAGKVSAWVISSRRALIRNGNDVAVAIQAFFDRPGLFAVSDLHTFAPAETRELTLPYDYERMVQGPGQPRFGPSLVIVDSAGRTWVRTDRGNLRPLADTDRDELHRRLDETPNRMTLDGGPD